MLGDLVVATGGQGLGVFVCAGSGVLVLALDGHGLVDDIGFFAHGVTTANIEF